MKGAERCRCNDHISNKRLSAGQGQMQQRTRYGMLSGTSSSAASSWHPLTSGTQSTSAQGSETGEHCPQTPSHPGDLCIGINRRVK